MIPDFLIACWRVLCELAPWLLLGMVLSGVMHVLLPKNFIRRKLQGTAGVVKAVALGVPLPLCSCGVVPAGIGLKNQGASNGAAVGFLISTPQTGVDSILVSASFFGWPFAIFKMVTSGVTGVIGGWITDRIEKPTAADQLFRDLPDESTGSMESEFRVKDKLVEIWLHGSEIVQSIWIWLAIGILVSAAIEVVIPDTWLETIGSWGLLPAMLLVLVISIPLYVCATASVPIAAAFVNGGLPPAAALVFLVAGPATNITTMGAVQSRFGWRTLVVYLTTITLGSMLSAWLFDWLLTAKVVENVIHHHHHQNWWSIASAFGIVADDGSLCLERPGKKIAKSAPHNRWSIDNDDCRRRSDLRILRRATGKGPPRLRRCRVGSGPIATGSGDDCWYCRPDSCSCHHSRPRIRRLSRANLIKGKTGNADRRFRWCTVNGIEIRPGSPENTSNRSSSRENW